jgi:DNA-binding response OmpR family regulator
MMDAYRPRVLIVDDAEDVRKLLGLMLQSEGIDVVAEAADGAQGAELALEEEIDAVVMDLRMPVMGGIEATRRIKQSKPGIHVFVFTAVDSPDEETMALEAGADEYLVKGTDAINLPARILAIQTAA